MNRTLAAPQRNAGDFDCSGEDIERDWVARTGCWSHTERVLLTYEQVRAYELPATEGKRGDPRPDARGPHQSGRPAATGIRRGLGRLRRRRQPTGADVTAASAAPSSILNSTFTVP